MTTDETREVMEAYLDALVARGDYGRFFAPDVVFTIEGTDQRADGAAAVEGLIRYLHEQAFDATPVVRNVVVEGDTAVLEAEFVGRHTGEFGGVAATGRDVRVPYTVVYDLADERITALRGYLPPEYIAAQLGAGAAATATA